MDEFLGAGAFDGVGAPAPVGAAQCAGQARFDGLVLFVNWPHAAVAAALPAGMSPAPNTARPELHPVLFVMGQQRDGALVFAGITIPTGIGYGEVGIGIPFVRDGRDSGLHLYIARMYSSYFPAVWSGNAYYGFAKRLATIRANAPALAVEAEDGAPLLRADIRPAGEWVAGTACPLAHFDDMCAAAALPVVGRHASGDSVCSRFDWRFDAARVRAVTGWLAIEKPLGPGLVPGRWPIVPDGGFEVDGMLWRLTWPTRRR